MRIEEEDVRVCILWGLREKGAGGKGEKWMKKIKKNCRAKTTTPKKTNKQCAIAHCLRHMMQSVLLCMRKTITNSMLAVST